MLNNQESSVLMLIKDLGQQFQTCNSKRKYRFGIYKCSCGIEFKARTNTVVSGHTKSCGCHKIKVSTTHGMTKHILYSVWHDMINRVFSKKNKSFKDYGERGIKVCERWQNVANFIEDMYPTFQKGLSLDRINNNGDYEPSNCRWATKEVQIRNRRVIQSNNNSGYKGVCWNKQLKKWVAQIGVNNKQIRLGYFNTPLDAAKAYDSFVIENHLEHTVNEVLNEL